MLLIARENIAGIHNDEGLFALNGIISIYIDTDSEHEAIDMLELTYPDFKWHSIDIIRMN